MGPPQVCGGLAGGVEAAIHAVRRLYDDEDTEAILMVDAENAFNSLNREAAMNNLQYTCPEFFKYVLNTYRQPAQLYVANSDEILTSEEGTTQGDTSAMGIYACSLMPLVNSLQRDQQPEPLQNPVTDFAQQTYTECLHRASYPKQVWYADDSAAGGKLKNLKIWWDDLKQQGPMYGYHPKASKTWLIVKPAYLQQAKQLFSDVEVTDVGHRYLGSYIGSATGISEFLNEEITSWKCDISGLSDISTKEPQLAYSAFVYGTSKRWNFVARTTPNISELLYALEYHIKEAFIPAVIGKMFVPENLRRIFSLPAKMGGLGIHNIIETSDMEYENSTKATAALTDAIYNQADSFDVDEDAQAKILAGIKKNREEYFKLVRSKIMEDLSPSERRQLDLLSEKGASSWLTSLPLKEYGFLLNKLEFFDAIALRYNLTLSALNRPKQCVCGETNNINHCLTCKRGGYVSMRHDSLRNTTAKLLEQVCSDVYPEPPLINVAGEQLPPGTNLKDGTRLDVSARNFWTPLDRAFTDIRVLHPQAPSNSNKSILQMYHCHEQQKKRKYNARVLTIEKATFTPLVFSTTGGMGNEAAKFYNHLADKISRRTGQRYSDVVAFVRRRLRFDLLKTCIISLRGYRGKPGIEAHEMSNLDINLRPQVT